MFTKTVLTVDFVTFNTSEWNQTKSYEVPGPVCEDHVSNIDMVLVGFAFKCIMALWWGYYYFHAP